MKQQEMIDAMLAGKQVLPLEFRSSKAETIRWRDKESKQNVSAPILRHNCENKDGIPYAVSERVDDKFDVATYKSPFKKGDKVVVEYTAMVVNRGVVTFNGKLERLEA